MKFLITGANFSNKGAQSMLFIAVDEIRKHLKDAEIYFTTYEDIEVSGYKFKAVFSNPFAQDIALQQEMRAGFLYAKCFTKECIKRLLGRKASFQKMISLRKIMPSIDVIIDVSGFAFGKKWPAANQEFHLNNIRLAKKYNIPIYLMPQSFGSFDYPSDKAYLLKELEDLLKYPKIIFAREQQGKDALEQEFHLTNVKLSSDLVLQNAGVNLSNVYETVPEIMLPELSDKGNVAIIPNKQCFNHGDKDKNLAIYKAIIQKLLADGKNIYVFRHSHEDLEICKLIYDMFDGNEKVYLLTNDFSCFEYDQFIRKFDFVICSRFHGIVHAYRNYKPAIALGWEIKYMELALAVGQEAYSFDITDNSLQIEKILAAIESLNNSFTEESKIIEEKLEKIREDNCFNYIDELNN